MNVQVYGWVSLGILVSVLLPPLWQYVRQAFPGTPPLQPKALPLPLVSLWQLAKPYLALGLASALTALLVVAFIDKAGLDFKAALLAGYAWDSTLQKLRS